MATFPRVRSLIVPPSQWWSKGATASLVSNTLVPNFPADGLTDGSVWPVCKMVYGTGTTRISLTAARTPNIFGVLAHNFQPGLVVGVQNEAGLNRGFAARDPNCWIDLRGFPTTAQHWDLLVTGNDRGVGLGEIVVATGFEFEGVFRIPYDEQVQYWQERDQTEYGKVYIAASGSMTRTCQLTMTLIPADATAFAQVCDEASLVGTRVLVVPDTRRNDIWLAEWPSGRGFRYNASYQEAEVEFTLLDQSPGVRA